MFVHSADRVAYGINNRDAKGEMAMGEHTAVVAICDTHTEVEAALKELKHAAFNINKLSIVGQDYRPAKHVEDYSNTADGMKYGSTAISGIGPVLIAGPLLGWVLGALEEPLRAGGITAIGTALKNMGIPKDSVLSYETALRFGKFLLLVHGTAEEVAQAQHIMQMKRARAIVERAAAAFKDVTNAKEDREKLINQAQGYRNDIIPRAKGEAAERVNQARGFAQARLNRAQGEANRFLATLKEYSQAKDVLSKRIYIEPLEEILPNVEKVIIDGKGGERVLPYLPLDRLSKSSSAPVAKPAPQPEMEEPRPEPLPTLRPRGTRP